MPLIAGVDGCRSGWVVILKDLATGSEHLVVAPTFACVVNLPGPPLMTCVDIPIGLLNEACHGGREGDVNARRLLGRKASSVFPPPARPALRYNSYAAANKANKKSSPATSGISKQSFALFPKLREVDEAMTPKLQERIREVHPELCFFEMNNCAAEFTKKKSPEGVKARLRLLERAGFRGVTKSLLCTAKGVVGVDDILDAYAACWTAERIHRGVAICIPPSPPVDSKGLRIEMWR